MTTTIPPILERRVNPPWHTPQDCYKLLATQEMVTGLHDIVAELKSSVIGINDRLDKGQSRMDKIDSSIITINAVITEGAQTHARLESKIDQGNAANEELLDILRAAKGFFTVGGWLANGVKWIAGLITGGIALYLALKGLEK